MRNKLVAGFIIFLVSGCASTGIHGLVTKPGISMPVLGVDIEFKNQVPQMVKLELARQLDDFIILYNSQHHLFQLEKAENPDINCLQVQILFSTLVSPKQQSRGVIMSVIGLSFPILMASVGSPIIFAFWYFPKATLATEVSLSDDIDDSRVKFQRRGIRSPGFLKSPERQVAKQGQYFRSYLFRVMGELENNMKKQAGNSTPK